MSASGDLVQLDDRIFAIGDDRSWLIKGLSSPLNWSDESDHAVVPNGDPGIVIWSPNGSWHAESSSANSLKRWTEGILVYLLEDVWLCLARPAGRENACVTVIDDDGMLRLWGALSDGRYFGAAPRQELQDDVRRILGLRSSLRSASPTALREFLQGSR